MTQLFKENKVVPVTAIDLSGWLIIGTKNLARDGYCALIVAKLRDRFEEKEFNLDWLKKKNDYFGFVKEVKVDSLPEDLILGSATNFMADFFAKGSLISVTANSKGRGFAGAVKRHGFKGGKASHGDKTGRKPGSIGFMSACGKVIKGKKMPGRMGGKQFTIQDLTLVELKDNLLFVKGSVPGKSGSLVYMQKGDNK